MSTPSGRVGAYSRPWYGLDTRWMRYGACDGISDEDKRGFFADNLRGSEARLMELAAKQRCWGCGVKDKCLEYAIAGDQQGIWGGLNRRERDDLVKLHTRQRAI